ncbi:MAG: hypothetical protein QOJ39_1468 [Candidatus Eremiobacteraeota bacterium]|jgi:hypothetical protein|nr:hypothetical protein [Candidatus Eremiobacteraeota bacterium]
MTRALPDPFVAHLVRRTERRNERYYLVPLALQDGTGEVLRFDEGGHYLGRAFGTADDARALIDIDPIARVMGTRQQLRLIRRRPPDGSRGAVGP